jgi:hypothetical protein
MPQPNSSQTDDFDLQVWLADITAEGSLTPEEVKSLGTILGNDKVKSKLRDQVLMRRDYSKKTQELADQRRQVEADVNEILKERQDLANWKAGIDNQLKKAYADLDSERSTAAQFRARIQTIAEQSGLDPAELMQGLPAAAAATGAAAAAAATAGTGTGSGAGNGTGTGAPPVDVTKFVSTEDFNSFARRSPMLYAEVEDIFSEHQELTGKPLKMEYTDSAGKKWTGRRALLVKAAEHNNRAGNRPMSVRDVWETDFNIPQVRQQQLESSIEGRVREKLDAEYKTKLSEQLLNGGTPGRTTPLADRPKSVLFDDKRDQRTPAERESAAAAPGGDNGAAHNTPPPTSAAGKEERWQRAASSFINRRAQGVPMGQEAPAKGSGL